jgi:Ulp1 family protease
VSRGHDDVESSDCHFFTSHFYSALIAKGEKGVESWTAKKNIDVFKKKLIFIPINMTLHWSLCVVVNPGSIVSDRSGKDNSSIRRIPCMLFFDSLNMHRKSRVRTTVMSWLNSEWARLKKTPISGQGPYSRVNFHILCPKGEFSRLK